MRIEPIQYNQVFRSRKKKKSNKKTISTVFDTIEDEKWQEEENEKSSDHSKQKKEVVPFTKRTKKQYDPAANSALNELCHALNCEKTKLNQEPNNHFKKKELYDACYHLIQTTETETTMPTKDPNDYEIVKQTLYYLRSRLNINQ